MTPEERTAKITNMIWYWFPVRWTDGTDWWEILSVTITGDEAAGGVELLVRKNESEPALVTFSNAEIYGEGTMACSTARARVMAV